jgi:hypothetical protein
MLPAVAASLVADPLPSFVTHEGTGKPLYHSPIEKEASKPTPDDDDNPDVRQVNTRWGIYSSPSLQSPVDDPPSESHLGELFEAIATLSTAFHRLREEFESLHAEKAALKAEKFAKGAH